MGYLAALKSRSKEELINNLYNHQVAEWADYDDNQKGKHGYGKRIPYIGWFWRHTDFANKRISIGNCGDFIGVMENNKWDYPEREMTEQEADTFIDYLEQAFAEASKINDSNHRANAEKVFDELWKWFQTLEVR